MSDPNVPNILNLATGIAVAFITNHKYGSDVIDLAKLMRDSYKAVTDAHIDPNAIVPPAIRTYIPAVRIEDSIQPDYLVSLENGRHFKSLKRHLGLLGMTPDDYRTKWNLPASYPMVAPAYAALRSKLAKDNGLGRK